MPRLSALPLALALSAATAAAQTPPPACSLDDVAVPFATPLTLLHSLAPPSALAEYPFVEVLRAARVRVDFPVGDTAPLAAYVALETAAVRLRGTAHADAVPLFPARPIRFGGLLIPLARHGLHLHGASPEGVLVAPIPRRAGAPLTTGAAAGERTRVTVHDRDLRWADGVTYSVPTAQLAGCASR